MSVPYGRSTFPVVVTAQGLVQPVLPVLDNRCEGMQQAYTVDSRTSRLDLDDYNHEVEEGLHITSMAGTWMSIVEGFGGMRIKNNMLSFVPKIPKQWKSYSFKVNFRNQIIKVSVSHKETYFEVESNSDINILVNGEITKVSPNNLQTA